MIKASSRVKLALAKAGARRCTLSVITKLFGKVRDPEEALKTLITLLIDRLLEVSAHFFLSLIYLFDIRVIVVLFLQ